MNATTRDKLDHWMRPVRFVLVYSLVIATFFFALPILARHIESLYESMSQPARFALILVFAAAVAVVQFFVMRRRPKE